MVWARSSRPGKTLRHFPNPGVVRGHDHLGEDLGLLATLDDMLDERLARDQGQGLAGKRVEA